jgi:hypothetical protein
VQRHHQKVRAVYSARRGCLSLDICLSLSKRGRLTQVRSEKSIKKAMKKAPAATEGDFVLGDVTDAKVSSLRPPSDLIFDANQAIRVWHAADHVVSNVEPPLGSWWHSRQPSRPPRESLAQSLSRRLPFGRWRWPPARRWKAVLSHKAALLRIHW